MKWEEFKSLKPGDLVVYTSAGTTRQGVRSYNGLVLEVEDIVFLNPKYYKYTREVILKQPGFNGEFRTTVRVPQQLDIYKDCAI